MAVQKSRVSRSKKHMKWANKALTKPTLSEDTTTGEVHRRHHITPDGYYRGRKVIEIAKKNEESEGND